MNKPAYIQEFEIPHQSGMIKTTSVVIDFDEFEELLQTLQQSVPEITPEVFQCMLNNKHIPAIVRGEKTYKVFDKYNIKTELMSVIVRGAGDMVLQKYIKENSDGH